MKNKMNKSAWPSMRKRRLLLDKNQILALSKVDQVIEFVALDCLEPAHILLNGCEYELSQAQKQALYESALLTEDLLSGYRKHALEKEQFARLAQLVSADAVASVETLMFCVPKRYSQEQADILWQSVSQNAGAASDLITRLTLFVPSQAQIDALYESVATDKVKPSWVLTIYKCFDRQL